MMRVSKDKLLHAKSYTSFYDLFGSSPYNNIYKNIRKTSKNLSVYQTTCGDSDRNKLCCSNQSLKLNATQYVTSERYHLLNKDFSHKSVVRSTSTIFYDLDDVAKRHSFHCMNDISSSNVNLLKVMKIPLNTNGFHGFNGKADAIVQECATQIQPKLQPRDSIEINTQKIRKAFPDEPFLSSEIFLRDDIYDNKKYYSERSAERNTDRMQKFWSFAKYRTEYTKPVSEEKKRKRKDRGKRTEDPCPCQLFSYACPCTDKKSLTELAKNSKSLTVADQVTSTNQVPDEDRRELKSHRSKRNRNSPRREDKLLSTDHIEVTEKYEVIPIKAEQPANVSTKHDMPTLTDLMQIDTGSIRSKTKSGKKRRKITCPKCKENVEIVLSTTEEEESLKCVNSSMYRFRDSLKSGSKSPRSNIHKSVIAEDSCGHNPQCELVPVCQILPTDNVYLSHNCIRKQSTSKQTPKIIRITKACRHHPPCTVVPSCQRANVLKNNCEFIPPCLHRPRCVNLPLCVPFKNQHCEELTKHEDETTKCPHYPKCKYVPECQYEHLGNSMDRQVNYVSQVQNACEYLEDCQQSQFILSPKMTLCEQKIVSPCAVISPTSTFNGSKSNKSCQYDCPDYKCANNIPKDDSNDALVFIRDVGCQFRNKRCSPKDSEQSKISSTSFDFVDVKMGNYYPNLHTLRYEDKFTNPMMEEDLSESTVSIISLEVDSQCPAHGHRAHKKRSERATGFIPKQNTSPFVAYTTQRSQGMNPEIFLENDDINDTRAHSQGYTHGTHAVKSYRSFMRGKYKKMFSIRRRKKSKANSHGFGPYCRKHSYLQNNDLFV